MQETTLPQTNNVLIDTDILVDSLRGYKPSIDFLDSLTDITVSWITIMELVKGAQTKAQIKTILSGTEGYKILIPDKLTIAFSTDIFVQHRLSDGLDISDSIIAATAVQQELILITKNVKHYRNIEGLKLAKPY